MKSNREGGQPYVLSSEVGVGGHMLMSSRQFAYPSDFPPRPGPRLAPGGRRSVVGSFSSTLLLVDLSCLIR